MILQGKVKTPVKEVVLHCAAIPTGFFDGQRPFQVFATINKWHTERGFKNGFGYHGMFMPDGQFYEGRPFSMIGAHVMGHNVGTLGFLLIEGREIKLPKGYTLEDCRFDMWFTRQQELALQARLRTIEGIEKVSGHNDYAPKLCPGFKVRSSDWLPASAFPRRGDNFVTV